MGFACATKSSASPLLFLTKLTNSFSFDFLDIFYLIWHYSTRKKIENSFFLLKLSSEKHTTLQIPTEDGQAILRQFCSRESVGGRFATAIITF